MMWHDDVTLTVGMAFGYSPLATSPVFTDVTSYVRQLQTKRGRSSVQSRFGPGSGKVILDNQDGRFDPNNSSSPYSPDVIVSVPIRIQATYSSVTYDLFRGVVTGWPLKYTHAGKVATVTVPFVDDFRTLARRRLAVKSYTEDDAGSRIGEILDDVSWPASRRDVDSGIARVAVYDATSAATALAHIQVCAEGEAGNVYMSAAGDVVFDNRVTYSGGISPSVTFGTGVSESQYVDVQPNYDDKYLWNDARVSRSGGVEQTATDATSIGKYGQLTLARSTVQANDAESLNTAEWLVGEYSDSLPRIDSLTVTPEADPSDLWPTALGSDIGTGFTVKVDPPGTGTTMNETVVVDGVEHTIRPGEWVCTFRLRQVAAIDTASYWTVGSGQLGTATVLA